MYDINLIPDRILYRKIKFFGLIVKITFSAILIAATICLLLIPTYQKFDMKNKLFKLNASIDNIGLSELNAAENKLNQKIDEQNKIKGMFDTLPQDTQKVTDVINRITQYMPASLLATDIHIMEGKVSMSVEATSRTDISAFLERLHNDVLFSDIGISGIVSSNNQFGCTISIVLNKSIK